MKPVIQLVAVSLLALSTVGLTALAGCSAPTPTTLGGDDTEDPNTGDSASTGKLPPKKTTNTSGDKKPTPATPPAADPTADPAAPPATPTTPAPGGDPQACMDQCAATGPAATYWTCSAKCQDQACDDNCWNPTCGQNAQACESALDTCATQCGAGAPPP